MRPITAQITQPRQLCGIRAIGWKGFLKKTVSVGPNYDQLSLKSFSPIKIDMWNKD